MESKKSNKKGKDKSFKVDPRLGQYIESIVKRYMQTHSEQKFIVATDTNTLVNYSGSVGLITNIPQGDTDSERSGDSLTLDNVEVHFSSLNGTTGNNFIRLLVFQWFPNTADAVPVASDILQTTATAYSYLSPYNHDRKSQFRILYDHTLHTSLTSFQNAIAPVKKVSIIVRKKIDFVSGTTNGSNHIYKLYISDVNTTLPTMDTYIMVRYRDY